MAKPTLEMITWDDHSGPHARGTRKELAERVKMVRRQTVGWVIWEDEGHLALASTKDEDKHWDDVTAIGKGLIVHRALLVEEPGNA